MSDKIIDTTNMSDQELKNIIASLQNHLEIREKENQAPKVLDNINTDNIVSLAKEIMSRICEGGKDEDDVQWCYEAVMETVYGKNIWKFINSR
jgi:hypothetical protein